MKESEAKTKWCPFSRPYEDRMDKNEAPTTANRIYVDGEDKPEQAINFMNSCMGSHCMAWVATKPEEGYCGLAGGR